MYAKPVKILCAILIGLFIIVLILVLQMAQVYRSLQENPKAVFHLQSDTAVHEGNEFSGEEKAETITCNGTEYRRKQDMITVLLMGIDWDGSKERADTGKRSDMTMLCTVDLQAGTVSLYSLPRDTRTNVFKVNEGTGEAEGKAYETKLCHAYQLGYIAAGDEAGAKNQVLAVQNLIECDEQLHIPIDYYVSIDLEHLPKLAEALGGVSVTLEQDMDGVGEEGETVTLDEKTTRLYLQNRKGVQDGEMDRQRHQQQFMKSFMKAAKDMGAVQAATKLFPQLAGNVIQTNLNLEQMLALAGVMDQLGSVDDVAMYTFPGPEDWETLHDSILGQDADFFIMDREVLLEEMLKLYYEQV